MSDAQADEICPATYAHEPIEFRHHRWTSDTSDGIARCVKCATRARFVRTPSIPDVAEIEALVERLELLAASPGWGYEPGVSNDFRQAASALRSLQERNRELEGQNEELRLAICGGEDAPGYAASLEHSTILQVLAENHASWKRASELAWDGETASSWKSRASQAEARLAEAEKLIAPLARVGQELQRAEAGEEWKAEIPAEKAIFGFCGEVITAGELRSAASFLSSKGKDEFGQTNGEMHSADPQEVQPTRSVSSAGGGE